MLQVYVKHLNMYHGTGNAQNGRQSLVGIVWCARDTTVNDVIGAFY